MKIPYFRTGVIGVLLSAGLIATILASAQNPPVNAPGTDEESKIAGIWRGISVCLEKGAACHNEIAVYRITTIPGRRGVLMVTGGKVVDGKEIVMGSGEWRFDREKHALVSERLQGVITLKVDGNKMEGTFVLPDKKALRRITLKKSEQ